MRIATEVFGEWAEHGKDTGMEKGHALSCQRHVEVFTSRKGKPSKRL